MGFLIQLLDEGSISMQQTILEVINNIGGSGVFSLQYQF